MSHRIVNIETPQNRTTATRVRRRVWPYVVGTAAVAAFVSAYVLYRLWTAPTPLEISDESSSMGEFILKIIMVGCVAACTSIGALLGWLFGYLYRSRG